MVAETPPQPELINGLIDLAAVRALIEPVVDGRGLRLYDVEWTASPAGQILRVTIERDDGSSSDGADGASEVSGVSLEDCVGVSRDLSTALDAVEIIPQRYNLEVSSPGLDRPLKTAKDFSRQVGRLAKLKLKEPASDGQRVLRGTLSEVVGDTVLIVVDGKRHDVPLDNIHQAKLVFELGAQKKKGQKAQQKRSGRQRKRTGS